MGVRRVVGLAAAMVGMAACATWARTFSAPTAAPPTDAFDCARAEAKAQGYSLFTFNTKSREFEARQVDDSASKMLPGAQQQVDKLLVKVGDAHGEGTGTLSVRAETVVRRFTRVGWVEDGGPASPAVVNAARAVVTACSGTEARARADSAR